MSAESRSAAVVEAIIETASKKKTVALLKRQIKYDTVKTSFARHTGQGNLKTLEFQDPPGPLKF